MKFTKQMGAWNRDFGKEYTEQNALSLNRE